MTTPTNDVPTTERKPRTTTTKRRRNFAGDLAKLETRVDSAKRLLDEAIGKPAETAEALLRIAIKTLTGD